MHQQTAYRAFAAKVPDLPLFVQPWYLDAVCTAGEWGAALVERGGKTVAALPWFMKQKWGWRYITMPVLCKQMGPVLLPEYRKLKWEMRLYPELIEALPAELAAFEQNFNYSVQNWLPFYWKGFQQSTCYSYVIPLNASEADLYRNITKSYRQKIQSAGQTLVLRHDLPVEALYRMIGLTFRRQHLPAPFSLAFLENLHAALQSRKSCRLFFAEDPRSGALHSASMLVWDSQSAYYLVSGDDPELRASGAAVWLKWEAIRYAREAVGVPVFDFEGSMMPRIEQGRRDFGAEQRSYFRVHRQWSALWKWRRMLKG